MNAFEMNAYFLNIKYDIAMKSFVIKNFKIITQIYFYSKKLIV